MGYKAHKETEVYKGQRGQKETKENLDYLLLHNLLFPFVSLLLHTQ